MIGRNLINFFLRGWSSKGCFELSSPAYFKTYEHIRFIPLSTSPSEWTSTTYCAVNPDGASNPIARPRFTSRCFFSLHSNLRWSSVDSVVVLFWQSLVSLASFSLGKEICHEIVLGRVFNCFWRWRSDPTNVVSSEECRLD